MLWDKREANVEDDLRATNLSADLSTTVDEIVAVSPGDVRPGAEQSADDDDTTEFPERPEDVEIAYDYEGYEDEDDADI